MWGLHLGNEGLSGSNTFAISFSSASGKDLTLQPIVYSGVSTTDPEGATAGAAAENTKQATVNITTETDDSIIVSCRSAEWVSNGPFTPDAGITERADNSVGTGDAGLAYWAGEKVFATAGATTMGSLAEGATAKDYVIGAVELKNAVATGPSAALLRRRGR